jgi:hypothetical protein
MTDFSLNEFFGFFFKDPSTSPALLQRSAERLEAHSSYRVCDSWLSPRGQLGILNVRGRAHGATGPEAERSTAPVMPQNRLRKSPRLAWIQAGYTTSEATSWEAGIRVAADGLRCADAGGIAAFCAAWCDGADEEQLFVWSTRPGLRSITSAEGEQMFVVGTRPLLVHRLARDFAEADLDRSYVLGGLVGWSLGERTPYKGASLVPVDGMVRIRNAVETRLPHPTRAYQREGYSPLFRQSARYQAALREAVEPLRSLPGFELRLSGGKDSRLVAAALYDRGIVPSTVVCHGLPGEWETPVAQRVAQALNWQLKLVVPEYAYLGNELDTVRHNLSLADGFLATEPLQSPYPQFGISGDRGPGLTLGHIELQRGGWVNQMRTTREKVLIKARGKLTPLRDCVVPPLVDAATGELDAYMASLDVHREAEYLYWINYRFRVCRWLTSHYLVHSKKLLPIYPLVDEKVVRLVSSGPLRPLVREKLVFAATRAFAPQLANMPLFQARYRFEFKWPSPSFLRGYRARTPVQPAPSSYLRRELRMPGRIAHTLCEHIRQGKLRDELKHATAPAVWSVIEDPSHERVAKIGIERDQLSRYLWQCFQASVLYTEGLHAV